MKILSSLPLAAAIAVLLARPVHGAELVVGAPVELADSVHALSSAFLAQEKDLRLRFVVDTSAKLYGQVAAGAPVDVFMSTSLELQARLVGEKNAVYESWTMYGAGRIVLWAADRRYDVSKGIRLLADPAISNVAVAGPFDSNRMAAMQAIGHAGLLEKSRPRLVDGDDMQSLVKLVGTGQAQVAFLSYDTVLAPAMKGVGRYALIPASSYQNEVIGHAAIVTGHGKSNPAAYRFIRFLKSARAQAILIPRGFMPPPAASVDVR
jgi:molybdate transport system substrate-binding protein